MAGKKKTKNAVRKKVDVKKGPAKKPKTEKKTPPVPKRVKDFYVVGIGASAGGLEAFEKFFQHMPPDPGMAFVLVPHLDPTHVSIMPDLMKKYANIDVFAIKDGMAVQPNCVYVIPPTRTWPC